MSTPVHLSGVRPATAGSQKVAQSAAQSAAQSVAQSQHGSQGAIFDLLFALQLGAGGWEAEATEGTILLDDAQAATDPALPLRPADLPSPVPDAESATADPAALLWNPFSERSQSEAKVGSSDTGEADEAPASAIGAADDSDKNRGPRVAHALSITPAQDPAQKDASGSREYSQAEAVVERDPDAGFKSEAIHTPQSTQPTQPGPAPLTVASLDAPMGATAFREQLASQIAVFIDHKQLSAQIQVNPPELGPVDVQIRINADQVEVDFFATQADARDAIENAIPRLREMLAEQGLSLGSAHVGTGDDPRAFAGSLSDGWSGKTRDPVGTREDGTPDTSVISSDNAAPVLLQRSLRLVDTFA
jgi:flagellar hook-length control protein FliK